MAVNGSQERQGRETRLLILVVVVSIAVLLLLARLRFPAAGLAGSVPAPGPLIGLARQAAFDDLAQTMNVLIGRISPRVAVVELGEAETPARGGAAPPGRRGGADKPATPVEPPTPVLAIALMIRPDVGLLHVPQGLTPATLRSTGTPIELIAEDSDRHLVLVRVSPAVESRAELPLEPFGGFSYVGVVGAARGGPTIQPVFVGRVASSAGERWPGVVLGLDSGPGLPAGALVFSIDARLVGMALPDSGGGTLVIPASVLESVAAGLLTPPGSVRP